ncbi:MAG: BatA domain-containing protein, partial [Akkermansiaceae bacterium]|nr:BatA domain-containing protein [Akkermansiaceae bacterium]
MPIIFANPWGLLGLLAVTALLAIHFLQRRTKTIPVTTLFLIEQRRDQARMGRRFDRLISSVPLWLQLLMALLLAAHLAQPRLPAAGSVLRLAVVVDDSASMRVFKTDLIRELAALAERHRGQARHIEWLVMPANPSRPRLYAGSETSAMLATLDSWQPVEGVADPRPALHLARERVGLQGMVVYATDTPCEALPADAVLMAVGRPIDNTGCTGATVGMKGGVVSWQALVSNNGSSSVNRQWHLEWDGKDRTETATVAVPAGGTASVGGPLPAGATRLCLVLEPDTFALDDRFPFLAPAPKPLYFRSQLAKPYQWLPERVERSVPGMGEAASGEVPDLVFAASADGLFPTVTGPAILMSRAADPAAMTLADPVAAIRHPLVDGLVWESLSVMAVPMIPADPNDTVLVWAGSKPLISLRPLPPPADGANSGPATGQLILHFNPNQSNFDRLPAAAVLMLRYCEELRLAKRGTAREQLEP